jgi:hypothetical protein
MVYDERERLALASAAIRQGDRARARELIYAVLDENPHNVAAWSWACEVATTRDERIHCLKQILAINPSHDAARRYLAQLQNEVPAAGIPASPMPPHTVTESTRSQGRKARVGMVDLLLFPLGWVFQLSLVQLFLVLLVLVLIGGFVYLRANTSFLGLVGLDFDTLTLSDSYDQIAADDLYWTITFESKGTSEFSGIVRHVSPFRMGQLRILTHDILVTSGDYANPDVVSTSVFSHHFTWRSSNTAHPSGRINLLHTVPANEEIYRQLLKIRAWDEVVITGREILSIRAYDQDGNHLIDWRDTGCNTLLVKSVNIVRR